MLRSLALLCALAACGGAAEELSPADETLAQDNLAAIDAVVDAAARHAADCGAMASALREALAAHASAIRGGAERREVLDAHHGDEARRRWLRIVPLLQHCAEEPGVRAVVAELAEGEAP